VTSASNSASQEEGGRNFARPSDYGQSLNSARSNLRRVSRRTSAAAECQQSTVNPPVARCGGLSAPGRLRALGDLWGRKKPSGTPADLKRTSELHRMYRGAGLSPQKRNGCARNPPAFPDFENFQESAEGPYIYPGRLVWGGWGLDGRGAPSRAHPGREPVTAWARCASQADHNVLNCLHPPGTGVGSP